jgi:crotonobetainyl-CoA hydratase
MLVLTQRHGHVVSVLLNRPEAANAFNADLARAFGQAISDAVASGARAIVIAGEGKGFSAGLDLKAFASGDLGMHPDHPEWGFAGFVRQPVPVPVIASVHGFAAGGGAEVALTADLVIADEDAVFSFPETGYGLVAGAGGPLRLTQASSLRVALDVLLTGRRIDAHEAQRHGLVTKVAAHGEALPTALELASVIAERSPAAVRATKCLVYAAAVQPDEADAWWTVNAKVLKEILTGPDAAEGAAAFAERRPPVW